MSGHGAPEVHAGPGKAGGNFRLTEVQNKYGSVAGASSGDFHTYRHHRRTEMDRLAAMDSEAAEAEARAEMEAKLAANASDAAKRTSKNAVKRKRQQELRKNAKYLKPIECEGGDAFALAVPAISAEDLEELAQPPAEVEASLKNRFKSDGSFMEAVRALDVVIASAPAGAGAAVPGPSAPAGPGGSASPSSFASPSSPERERPRPAPASYAC
jgi:hypothetical protein